uniref:alpha-N-acetylgalactosaminide alpha-2,6-sialyltransferase n=1 Tax=Poecilia mexicana TaxID=48701 RepID=A0A3B3YE73_9TELE
TVSASIFFVSLVILCAPFTSLFLSFRFSTKSFMLTLNGTPVIIPLLSLFLFSPTLTTALTLTLHTHPSFFTPIPIIKKSSFNKLPLWSFEDIYNLDAPPRPTFCLDYLCPVFNRLSHVNNPFRFMDMKYNVKQISNPEELLLLPKPGEDGCVHCAVVGTAGVLDGSKTGAEIDAHDYVFQTNGAVIPGYEEDVGNQTHMCVCSHTAHSITASLTLFKKYRYKSAPHDEGIKYDLIPEGLRDFQWLKAVIKGERVSSGQFRNRNRRNSTIWWMIRVPTSNVFQRVFPKLTENLEY